MKYLFLLLFPYMYSCAGKAPVVKTGLEGQELPNYKLLRIDSSSHVSINKPEAQPVVVFLFSPSCPYCRAQTKEIITHINSLANIQFYLLSNSPLNSIKQYYKHFNLDKYSNITVGQDYSVQFIKYFKATEVPYLAIYNKEKILQKVFIGNVSNATLKSTALN